MSIWKRFMEWASRNDAPKWMCRNPDYPATMTARILTTSDRTTPEGDRAMSIEYPKTVLYARNGKSYYFRHDSIFSPEDIAKIEEMKNAKYVCDTCLFGKGGWVNNRVAVFWNKDPANIPAMGSAWFGLFWRAMHPHDPDSPKGLVITNAISAHRNQFDAVVADDGEVVWSRYRHDYRFSADKTAWIDGGRDYTRWSGSGEMVKLGIVDGDLTIVENWETQREAE